MTESKANSIKIISPIGGCLIGGIIMGTLMDSIAGTALSFARLDMPGDIYATSDEFATLDFSYTSTKIISFMTVPWLFARWFPLRCLKSAVVFLIIACGLMVSTVSLNGLIMLRAMQGLAGGILIVGSQTFLFQLYSSQKQPTLQAFFALGAVLTPAMLAPALQGWLVDNLSWSFIFISASLCGVASFLFLLPLKENILKKMGSPRLDYIGFALFCVAAICLTYVAQQGSRWNWWENRRITALMIIGTIALLVFIAAQAYKACCKTKTAAFVDAKVFDDNNFLFAFPISFITGIVLFGSTYLISSLTLGILGFTATSAGLLMIPGVITFIASMLVVIFFMQKLNIPGLVFAPIGIVVLIISMWMLTGSTSESGSTSMTPALLTRAGGLGLLILAINVFALNGLKKEHNVQGVALFITLRQAGGLFGVAMLQAYFNHQSALNKMILSSHLSEGCTLVSERLGTISSALQAQGMESGDAAKAAVALLNRSVDIQASVLSFNEAFFALVLLGTSNN